jgi:ParB-like chromosome segregation protein Spo0J
MSGWRDHLKVHPACEAIPPISEEELKGLAEDIKQHGLQKKIVLWRDEETGKESLLDGRSRLDAMEMAGIEIFDPFLIEELRYGPDKENHPLLIGLYEIRTLRTRKGDGFPNDVKRPADETPEAYVRSANVHRRHLDTEGKRKAIANLLKLHPEKSNRQIGAEVGASHVTVGAVRAEMESTGQIDQLPKTVGKDGKQRKQPASKPGMLTKHLKAAAKEAERLKRGKEAYERYQAEAAAKQEPEAQAVMPAPEAMAEAEETFRRLLSVIQQGLADDVLHALNICGLAAFSIMERVYWEKYPPPEGKDAGQAKQAKLH